MTASSLPTTRPGRPPLSIQLWSTRGDTPLAEQLHDLAEMGYRDVQPFHDQYDDVEGMAALLAKNGMTARSGHFTMALLERETDRVVAAARRLGMDLVVAPWIDPEERPDDVSGWIALHERLLSLNARMQAEGLAFAWHNHDFEFVPLPDGSLPIEHILGSEIAFAADIAWIVRAGVDPVPWLRRYAGRVPAVHVKDVAPHGSNLDEMGFADIGEGTMDWPALWSVLDDLDVPLRIAEHDQPSDWRRFARSGARAIAALDRAISPT